MRPWATATACFAVLAVTAMVTFTAIAESRRRGHWCSSPRFVVTTYAAINKIEALIRADYLWIDDDTLTAHSPEQAMWSIFSGKR